MQQRIKFQKFSNADYPHANKIDIVIVVDMLLTGFDSKYLNTLYVDKNLKYHGLIQAFSRTNRILNDTKPYGNILDFRQQQSEVDTAIALFSGEAADQAKEIWLVEPAPVVIERYEQAVQTMSQWMQSKHLVNEPHEVYAIKGDTARVEFIQRFKEVQRLKTQLDQYTDLNETQQAIIESLMPEEQLRAFRGAYLEIAKQLKATPPQGGSTIPPAIEQLDFEFVLFASAVVDYDYIMGLIARYTQSKPNKQVMTREQLVSILSASANLMEERDDMIDYIATLHAGKGLQEHDIRDGYQQFKAEKIAQEVSAIAHKHTLDSEALHHLMRRTLERNILDHDMVQELFVPLDLGWKERTHREETLIRDLMPLLKKQAEGRDIAGLKEYE